MHDSRSSRGWVFGTYGPVCSGAVALMFLFMLLLACSTYGSVIKLYMGSVSGNGCCACRSNA